MYIYIYIYTSSLSYHILVYIIYIHVSLGNIIVNHRKNTLEPYDLYRKMCRFGRPESKPWVNHAIFLPNYGIQIS